MNLAGLSSVGLAGCLTGSPGSLSSLLLASAKCKWIHRRCQVLCTETGADGDSPRGVPLRDSGIVPDGRGGPPGAKEASQVF